MLRSVHRGIVDMGTRHEPAVQSNHVVLRVHFADLMPRPRCAEVLHSAPTAPGRAQTKPATPRRRLWWGDLCCTHEASPRGAQRYLRDFSIWAWAQTWPAELPPDTPLGCQPEGHEGRRRRRCQRSAALCHPAARAAATKRTSRRRPS